MVKQMNKPNDPFDFERERERERERESTPSINSPSHSFFFENVNSPSHACM